jgi:hypothetical protein
MSLSGLGLLMSRDSLRHPETQQAPNFSELAFGHCQLPSQGELK